MTKVASPPASPIQNHNLKDMKPFRGNGKNPIVKNPDQTKTEITNQAKALNENAEVKPETPTPAPTVPDAPSIGDKAATVAKALSKIPVLPVSAPSPKPLIEKKVTEKKPDAPVHTIKKPAVIFIEGFSAFGVSNGDGIKDMADNYPGAKLFDWTDHGKIIDEIKKHAPDQPVVLVGHSFGGDTAIEIANDLNSPKNGFRAIDLLVSIDAVGMNKTVIPVNVKSNLNYFGEGLLPFVHGDPTVARNTKYTEVTNELRSDMHSKMDDNQEVQFEIFNRINDVVSAKPDEDIVIEIGEGQVKDILESLFKNKELKEA